MPPIAATASQSPSGASGSSAASVQQRTSGWICDAWRGAFRFFCVFEDGLFLYHQSGIHRGSLLIHVDEC